MTTNSRVRAALGTSIDPDGRPTPGTASARGPPPPASAPARAPSWIPTGGPRPEPERTVTTTTRIRAGHGILIDPNGGTRPGAESTRGLPPRASAPAKAGW